MKKKTEQNRFVAKKKKKSFSFRIFFFFKELKSNRFMEWKN